MDGRQVILIGLKIEQVKRMHLVENEQVKR